MTESWARDEDVIQRNGYWTENNLLKNFRRKRIHRRHSLIWERISRSTDMISFSRFGENDVYCNLSFRIKRIGTLLSDLVYV